MLVCFIALLAASAEFTVIFLPRVTKLPIIELTDSLILRVMFVALCLFIILVSVMFEYIIAILDNTAEKPLIVEEKRINY